MTARRRRLLQIPEVSVWNDYVALAEEHLRPFGFESLHPGVCRDDLVGVTRTPEAVVPHPDVVHVHWPDLLGYACGPDRTVSFLRRLARDGARIVQTVHNLWPHTSASWHRSFIDSVDTLTSGAHFFSAEHEALARLERPHLPSLSIHMMHPRYPGVAPISSRPVGAGSGRTSVGCFGRLRGYKRIPEFVGVLARDGGTLLDRIVVAGKPDDPGVDRKLRLLAGRDDRVVYRPGFHDRGAFLSLMQGVDWVALPYERVWSSGVLVTALQLGKRVLCPRPVGAAEYGVEPGGWTLVDPWDDGAAVSSWLAAIRSRAAVGPTDVPSWAFAARRIATFYDSVLSTRGKELTA